MLQTYIPLYRKYRPQTFKDLVGQEAISQTLTNAILHKRVAHAYLFTGPRGTGKTSSARILAKSLNCEKGPTPEPCGVCSSCVDITSGNALDVIEIDAASNRSVEDARDLIDRVQFAPVSGRYKVYIIDEVHMLTPQAFNTLLKTLEEPPPNLVFVLATTEIHKVLETIISRCQRFDFRRISQDAMVERLASIAKVENITISKEALNLIARRSAGGLRDALGLLDQISVLSYGGQSIEIKEVLSLIGALPEDMLLNISVAIANRDGSGLLKLINDLMELGSEPLQIVKELTIHFRNLLIASTVKENLDDIIDASREFFDDLKKIAQSFQQSEIAQIIDKLSYTERMVRNSSQPGLWLEVGLLSICYRHDIYLVEDLHRRVEELERMIASGGLPPELSISQPSHYVPKVKQTPQISYKEPAKPESFKQEYPKVEKVVEPVIPKELEKPTVQVEAKIEETQMPEMKQSDVDKTPAIAEPERLESKVDTPLDPQMSSSGLLNYPVDSTWQSIVSAVSNIPTRSMLKDRAHPISITSEEIVLASEDIFISQFKEPRREQYLKDAISKVLNTVPRVRFVLVSDQDSQVFEKKSEIKETTLEKKIFEPQTVKQKVETPPVSKQYVPDSDDEPSLEDVSVDQNVQEVLLEDLSEQVRIVKDIFNGKIIK